MSEVERLAAKCALAGASSAASKRVVRHLVSSLACLGRNTITGQLATAGRQFTDWTADYRLYSQERVDTRAMLGELQLEVASRLHPDQPVVVALDDTRLKKWSKRTPGVSYTRDPLGPKFRINLLLAQRFVQQSMAFTDGSGIARMIPVDFIHAPVAAKPRRNAAAGEWAAYRQAQREQVLGAVGGDRVRQLRANLDRRAATKWRKLIMVVDGGYTNKTFLGGLPARCCAIGRIRGDAKLYHLPAAQPLRGRRRIYGPAAPTPEELRQDTGTAWEEVPVQISGRECRLRVKTSTPLRWRATGVRHNLRLVVIAPLGYRVNNQGRQLYRKPAYLICTDPDLSVQEVVQYYIWRWDIEVNFRDEKTLIGVGQAQVHHVNSVERVPAMSVVAYGVLLASALSVYGLAGQAFALPPPKWQARPSTRVTPQQLITQLRHDLWSETLHYSDFVAPLATGAKPDNIRSCLASALFYGAASA